MPWAGNIELMLLIILMPILIIYNELWTIVNNQYGFIIKAIWKY